MTLNYNKRIFSHFARLLSYPETGLQEHVELLLKELVTHPEDADRLGHFCRFVRDAKHPDIEELFTRTFDMNPACCLEIGWHLYGEDYQRGQFLVKMRQSLNEENLPESGELPDHISHCLLFLTRLDLEDAVEFTKHYLLPAIKKIQTGFKDKQNNPYRHVIEVLQAILEKNYDIDALLHPALQVLDNGKIIDTNLKLTVTL